MAVEGIAYGQSAPVAAGPLVRNSTGLVREVKPWQAFVINFITGAPVSVVAIGLFGALSGFPGGSFPLGIVLVIPLALSVVYAFGFLTAAIPRSGGDYVLVSRILHPSLGVVSSVCMTLSSFLSIAFDGLAFTSLGIVPLLNTMGLVSNNHSLIHAASVIAGSKGWQFGIGAVAILIGGAVVVDGWTPDKRVLFGLLRF